MKFMGKAVVGVAAMGLAVAGSVIGAGTANAAGLYGAITFSNEDWSYATSIDAASRDEALGLCSLNGVSDCHIMVAWCAYASLARYYPPAILANVGSADTSGTEISEVLCTANTY
ncbi:hypothetical protein [Nocardia gipuzkoensis]|uniref:hypothetical protein n=1 Tax=Nocardia gipuzkoensis TaxID=2749991 RepID=UPI0015EFBB3D|nr:hypothetical protein [Nocardia gipuzkoensis]